MKLVRQPKGSKFCGHACVAMVRGTSLQRSLRLMRHRGGTCTRHLLVALGHRALDKRMRPVRDAVPEPAIVRAFDVRRGRRAVGHLVVYANGMVFDPEIQIPVPREIWVSHLRDHGWEVGSYLRVNLTKARPM